MPSLNKHTIKLPFVSIHVYWGHNYKKFPALLLLVEKTFDWPTVDGDWLS